MLDRLRQKLAVHLSDILKDHAALGLVQALTLGERSGFEPEDWEVLTRTGTNHLVAISGLHVGLIAAAVFFLVRWLWVLSPRLVLALAAPRAGALGAMAAALAYAALAGFAVSTQRALVMLAVAIGVNLILENLLQPVLLGDSLNVAPLPILLATTLGGMVAGMIGLVLAAPLLAITMDARRELKKSGFFDEPDGASDSS